MLKNLNDPVLYGLSMLMIAISVFGLFWNFRKQRMCREAGKLYLLRNIGPAIFLCVIAVNLWMWR